MTNRIELRGLVVAALQAAQTLAGDRIYVARTYPTDKQTYPLIVVRAPHETKQSEGRNGPQQFTTISNIEVTGRVENVVLGDLEDQLDTLSLQIEKAIINDFAISQQIQQITQVSMRLEISPNGREYLGDVQFQFDFEHFQTADEFASVVADELQGIDLHLDTVAPFDESGIYENPAFPDSVTEAPRTSGPDGRDEGRLSIDLT